MAKIILLVTTLTISYRYIETTAVGDVNSQKELGNNYIDIRNHTNYTNSSDEGLLYSEFVSHNNSFGNNVGLRNETNLQMNHSSNDETQMNFNNNNNNSMTQNSKYQNLSKHFLTNRIQNETNALDSFSLSTDVQHSLNSEVINDRASKNIINNISQYPLANKKEDHNEIILSTISTNISKKLSEDRHVENKHKSTEKEIEIIDKNHLKIKNIVKLVKEELPRENEWRNEQARNLLKATMIKRAQRPLNKLNRTKNDVDETRNLTRYNASMILLKIFNESNNAPSVNQPNVSNFLH